MPLLNRARKWWRKRLRRSHWNAHKLVLMFRISVYVFTNGVWRHWGRHLQAQGPRETAASKSKHRKDTSGAWMWWPKVVYVEKNSVPLPPSRGEGKRQEGWILYLSVPRAAHPGCCYCLSHSDFVVKCFQCFFFVFFFAIGIAQNSSLFYPDYSAQFLDSMNESKKSSWTQQTESLRFV